MPPFKLIFFVFGFYWTLWIYSCSFLIVKVWLSCLGYYVVLYELFFDTNKIPCFWPQKISRILLQKGIELGKLTNNNFDFGCWKYSNFCWQKEILKLKIWAIWSWTSPSQPHLYFPIPNHHSEKRKRPNPHENKIFPLFPQLHSAFFKHLDG